MTLQIDKKITGYTLKKGETQPTTIYPLEREEILSSRTYKVKYNNWSYYITISNQLVEGKQKPFELLIESKNPEYFEWLKAIALLISAILRNGIDIGFLLKELSGIMSPTGSGWAKILGKKNKNYSSILNIIGEVLEYHIQQGDI